MRRIRKLDSSRNRAELPRAIQDSPGRNFHQGLDSCVLFTYNNIIIKAKKGDDMGWRENKNAYVKSYVKGAYHRFTVTFRKDNKNSMDTAIWNVIKDAPSLAQALKDLAYKGLDK